MDWKIFWRITFTVCNGAKKLELELTLWDFTTGRVRLGRSVTDLTPDITQHGTVYYIGDRAVFYGGYLECAVDLDVEAKKLLDQFGIPLPVNQSAIGRESESLAGENVNIRADVVLYDQSGQADYPLFYFPQPLSDGIHLVERFTGSGAKGIIREIDWKISVQQVMTSSEFEIGAMDPQHRVRVQQDNQNGQDIFEFLIDSVPVAKYATVPNHKFTGDHQHFFIGMTPYYPDGLYGEIPYLEFDPNGTCKNCPASEIHNQ